MQYQQWPLLTRSGIHPLQVREVSLRVSCAELLCSINMGAAIFHELLKSLSEDILTFDCHISYSNKFFLLFDLHNFTWYSYFILLFNK